MLADGCFEALKIDYDELRAKGAQLGVVMSRVAIWDFNHDDQALMIPEAVRLLCTNCHPARASLLSAPDKEDSEGAPSQPCIDQL